MTTRTQLLPVLLLALVAGCRVSERPPEVRFAFSVDPALAPTQPTFAARSGGAPRPLATLRDAAGVQSDFVEDELLLFPASDDELNAFLARRQAVVLSDSDPLLAAALPPGTSLGAHLRQVTVRVGHPLDTGGLGANATAIGVTGTYTFSSAAGSQLIATAAAEVVAGVKVAPNFVAYPSGGFMRFTQEQMTGSATWTDAFRWRPFNGALPGVSNHSTVVGAWQYLEAKGYSPRSVPVAIIDSGFWLDSNDSPFDQGPGTDLPPHPDQFNVHTQEVNAGGENYGKCSGDSRCSWHGNGSAGVATGLMNNQKGAAGTGGQVASPLLLDVDMSDGEVIDALQIARWSGARVVNMSFGGSCNALCRSWRDDIAGYGKAFADTLSSGLVIVAAAGNDATNLDVTPYYPCAETGVICVGAMGTEASTTVSYTYDTHAISYSNWGAAVSVWAPTDIPVMPNGDLPGQLAGHNGTSASAPFVAGVVAMMMAVDPTLDAAKTRALLQQTAWTGSTDPKVKQVLDARSAVMKAGGYFAPDAFEPDETAQNPAVLVEGNYTSLSIHRVGDVDFYRLTLTDYSKITLYLDTLTQGFGALNVQLTPESAATAPGGVTEGHDANGYHYLAQRASPGTYLLRVSGPVQPYQLSYQTQLQPLTPDAWEVNDTVGAAAWLGRPSDALAPNFHVDGDVDFYRFTVTGVPDASRSFSVGLTDADVPVAMDLYDVNGTFLRSSTTSSFNFQAADNGSEFIVRFTNGNGTRGQYWFSYGAFVVPSSIPPFIIQRALPTLDSGDPNPFQRVLSGVDEWSALLTAQAPATGGRANTRLGLDTDTVHLALVDSTGRVVVEGQATAPTATGSVGEVMDFGSVITAGQSYYLHLTRTSTEAPDLSVPPAKLDYRLQFQQ